MKDPRALIARKKVLSKKPWLGQVTVFLSSFRVDGLFQELSGHGFSLAAGKAFGF
jgi:hypothetical protein